VFGPIKFIAYTEDVTELIAAYELVSIANQLVVTLWIARTHIGASQLMENPFVIM